MALGVSDSTSTRPSTARESSLPAGTIIQSAPFTIAPFGNPQSSNGVAGNSGSSIAGTQPVSGVSSYSRANSPSPSSECSDDPKDATFGPKLQVTVSSGTSKPPQEQFSKSHSHSITRREEIPLSELEAAVVEAAELTRLIVDNKANVKPSKSFGVCLPALELRCLTLSELTALREVRRRLRRPVAPDPNLENKEQHLPRCRTINFTGAFLWPVEEVRPEELLGNSLDALDPIRVDYKCHIVFDDKGPITHRKYFYKIEEVLRHPPARTEPDSGTSLSTSLVSGVFGQQHTANYPRPGSTKEPYSGLYQWLSRSKKPSRPVYSTPRLQPMITASRPRCCRKPFSIATHRGYECLAAHT
ncbi:hypothetical protein JMJ35_004663 [Cladonia borealis]|uniref:Uncharacterized protein n=1 Tax=Cladonia borealis TaxID=184061 RepID=A0AA39R399_9LECA|nr:hypothetical protein JMJ35_004663 [Cladonia borealis]